MIPIQETKKKLDNEEMPELKLLEATQAAKDIMFGKQDF